MEQSKRIPWYKQTAVWALVISVLAIALSQLPPINSWIAKSEIKVEVGRRIAFDMDIGIPRYHVFVDLENIGNRPMVLSNLELNIIHPGGKAETIPADTYVDDSSINFPPSDISLKPSGLWSGKVVFYPALTPNEEEEINSIRLEISNSFSSNRRTLALNKSNPNFGTVEADVNAVNRALSFFNRMFSWNEKGNYKVSLRCNQNGQKVTLKDFEFVLYDYHIKTLRSHAEDYKYGAGIIYPPNSQKEIWVSISKTN